MSSINYLAEAFYSAGEPESIKEQISKNPTLDPKKRKTDTEVKVDDTGIKYLKSDPNRFHGQMPFKVTASSSLNTIKGNGIHASEIKPSAAEVFNTLKARADKENDPLDLAQVGYLYEKGKGVGQSNPESFKYYKKSADMGDVDAQHRVANMYRDGRGTAINYANAYRYYDLSTMNDPQKKAKKDFDLLMGRICQNYCKLKAKTTLTAFNTIAEVHEKAAGRDYLSATAMELYSQVSKTMPKTQTDIEEIKKAKSKLEAIAEKTGFEWPFGPLMRSYLGVF